MQRLLEGKYAIVIGASRGIGAATAIQLAHHGAKVVIASRDMAKLEALAAEIGEQGGTALSCRTDVTEPASIDAAVNFAVERFGRLDIGFNNAAANPVRTPFADLALADFEAVMATNLRSVFVAMQAQIRAMLRNGGEGGAIINTSSAAGLIGMSGMASYVASKHGVVGLTKAAALEYGTANIRVNAIAPGAVWTKMLQEGSGGSELGQQKIREMTPMGRIGAPEEIAGAVVYLASQMASFVTGVTMPVDGGYVVP